MVSKANYPPFPTNRYTKYTQVYLIYNTQVSYNSIFAIKLSVFATYNPPRMHAKSHFASHSKGFRA